ncbi:MAG TPA: ATPase, partial [Myxococcales bacterium]|nr:ATPase [Myxococcales bacterium]
QAVIAGMYYAFGERTEPRQDHLLKAVEEAFPLSSTMGEEIARLREWSQNRTRPASAAQRLAVVR